MTTQQTALSSLQRTLARPTEPFRPLATRLTILSLAGIILVSALYLGLASKHAMLSHQLKQTAIEISRLQEIRADKLRTWSQLANPARMEERARAQGFREPARILYVNWTESPPQQTTHPNIESGTQGAAKDWWETLVTSIIAWIAEPSPAPRP